MRALGRNKMANYVWTSEEMILAADTAERIGWKGVNSTTHEVAYLSAILRTANYYPRTERPDSYRSRNSVGMKINNLRASHPSHTGEGLRPSKAEAEVVNLFILDGRAMHRVAQALLHRIGERVEKQGDAVELISFEFSNSRLRRT